MRKNPFNSRFLRWFLPLFLLLVSMPATSCGAQREMKIGVLANSGKEAAVKRWLETARYLQKKIPHHTFKIIPLDFHEIDRAVDERQVDFIIANPQIYIELNAKYGAARIATLKSMTVTGPHAAFGGVIFCRKDRSDIGNLQDLKGKSFMAVDETSLGGWTATWRELKAADINPQRDFSRLSFSGTHDGVVYSVRDRKVDAGTVRTDTLERMADEGEIDLADYRILNQQYTRSYASLLSTRLYPEWPFAKAGQTPDVLAEDVAIALLNMRPDDAAAQSAGISGWTMPLDYQPVHELMRELRIGAYKDYGKITLSSALIQYRYWLGCILLLLLLMALAIAYMVRLNRRLRQSRLDLERSGNELEMKVKERTAELKNSERRLADLINMLPDATFAIDNEGKIILWNRTAEELTGALAQDMLGKGNHEYSIPFYGVRRQILIDLVLATSGEVDHLYTYIKNEQGMVVGECQTHNLRGREAYLFGVAGPLYDSDGNITGAIESVRDVTERKEVERLKDEMISAVSHEMRTPLTAMLGYGELLLETEVSPEQQKAYLKILYGETGRLNEIIGNFLDLQRFRSGRQHFTRQSVAIAPLLHETADFFARTEQRHSLTLACQDDLPAIQGNGKYLRQVFNNLVSNAAKYSPNGGDIFLGATLKDDNIIITVRDAGIGIPPQAREMIFERFYRVDNSDRRAIGGTGLGLPLVREIVTAHGGKVWVESELDKGSTFFVSLPVPA